MDSGLRSETQTDGQYMKNYDPAQRELVHRHIDWGTVDRRLSAFQAIRRSFPLEQLKKQKDTPPYFCHYMAWRLGTWNNESPFERLEELLTVAEHLPNWKSEASLLTTADFATFWSLVWQLQVAEYLCAIGTDVQWCKSGPDLSCKFESEILFVECYALRKSFPLFKFIEEVLTKIDPDIRAEYDHCLRFNLPANSDRTQFLDSALSPLLNPKILERAKIEAQHQNPVVLSQPASSLVIYMTGPDDSYMPGIVPNRVGDTEDYLEVILREAVRAKQNANALASHRPNLVAVNCALSIDAQLAIDMSRDLDLQLPAPALGPNLDALAISTVGITERLGSYDLVPIGTSEFTCPALSRRSTK